MSATVKKEALIEVLAGFRDVRLRNVRRGRGPWAFRQALIMVLELDTATALKRGVEASTLEAFDATVRADSREWVRRNP